VMACRSAARSVVDATTARSVVDATTARLVRC
jgi:hypothetical protein